MRRQITLDTLALKPVSRPAHTEYSLDYHHGYIRHRFGVSDPASDETRRTFYDDWDIDLLWSVDDGLRGLWEEFGRCTDMGHAEYAQDRGDRRDPQPCPFRTPEEVWAFDAVAEYGLPSPEEQTAAYEDYIESHRQRFPGQLVTGGYYKTIISGAIQAFGWDMLLLACAEPARMEPVFDSFFRRSLFHMEAWARTGIEVIIQHDDFVWTSGPFLHPDIYRRELIPRYAELWKPLKQAGKTILFCSDGDFRLFAADLLEAGADGLIFEPVNEFGWMTERFGGQAALVGSYVDCRDLTRGPWDRVRRDVDRTLECVARYPGIVIAVGNHLPPNIPPEMMERYIRYLQANW